MKQKRILLRASRSPFDNFFNGPLPKEKLAATYKALHRPGTKNIGNLVFAYSTLKALSTPDTEISIDNYEMTLSDSFSERTDEINEQYDAFVIPLCNSFRRAYRTELRRMTATIQKLRIPCLVTGVGAQGKLSGDCSGLDGIKEDVKSFVSAVLDRSSSIGVRGEITRDYLKSLGFNDGQISVIGCPSMFYNGDEMKVERGSAPKSIAVNLSDIDATLLSPVISYLNGQPGRFTYIPQVRNLMKSLATNTATGEPRSLLNNNSTKFFCDLVPWIDFMRTQDFAIGTRIHGNIVSLIAGTPAHIIAHDSRTLELALYFQIPHTKITEIDKFDPDAIYERSDYGDMVRNHANRTHVFAKFLESNGLSHTLFDAKAREAYDQKVRASLINSRYAKLAA
jgi:hypothetical protein